MKVRIDAGNCMGHGLCAMRAPEVYVLNEDGFNDLPDFEESDPERQESARRGALACPERVITTED
ncbi:ferredoxin [Streptomyces sp. NPDC020983]|uniref:ferredoxin n=1 Tax=Streptomyces sp. NPDC020983 TaxID=3365106 RepID=UPI00379E140B